MTSLDRLTLLGQLTLLGPVTLAGRRAPSRVVFGPHETKLGEGRSLSAGHVAYCARRAAGGAGVIVTEVASVHDGDWPYERAPLAAAVAAGADGVEIDAGAGALLRQFHSGLTNQRTDAYGPGADRPRADGHGPAAGGTGRLALTLAVLSAVRAAIGRDHGLALRLCCDELAPWAGITPEVGAEQAAALAPSLNLLTVVRGGPYAGNAYRPDAHWCTIPMSVAVRLLMHPRCREAIARLA